MAKYVVASLLVLTLGAAPGDALIKKGGSSLSARSSSLSPINVPPPVPERGKLEPRTELASNKTVDLDSTYTTNSSVMGKELELPEDTAVDKSFKKLDEPLEAKAMIGVEDLEVQLAARAKFKQGEMDRLARAVAKNRDASKAFGIRVCGVSGYPLLSYVDGDNKLAGLMPMIWKRISIKAGLKNRVEVLAWSDAVKGMETGTCDVVVGAVTMSSYREKVLGWEYLPPIYFTSLSLLVHDPKSDSEPKPMKVSVFFASWWLHIGMLVSALMSPFPATVLFFYLMFAVISAHCFYFCWTDPADDILGGKSLAMLEEETKPPMPEVFDKRSLEAYVTQVAEQREIFKSAVDQRPKGVFARYCDTVWHEGMYWHLTTSTTVGYGDVTLEGTRGRVWSAFVMIMGALVMVAWFCSALSANLTTRALAHSLVLNGWHDLGPRNVVGAARDTYAHHVLENLRQKQHFRIVTFNKESDWIEPLKEGLIDSAVTSTANANYLLNSPCRDYCEPIPGMGGVSESTKLSSILTKSGKPFETHMMSILLRPGFGKEYGDTKRLLKVALVQMMDNLDYNMPSLGYFNELLYGYLLHDEPLSFIKDPEEAKADNAKAVAVVDYSTEEPVEEEEQEPEEEPKEPPGPLEQEMQKVAAGSEGAAPAGSEGAAPAGSEGAAPAGSEGAAPAGSEGAAPAGSGEAAPAGSEGAAPGDLANAAAKPAAIAAAKPDADKAGENAAKPGAKPGANAAKPAGAAAAKLAATAAAKPAAVKQAEKDKAATADKEAAEDSAYTRFRFLRVKGGATDSQGTSQRLHMTGPGGRKFYFERDPNFSDAKRPGGVSLSEINALQDHRWDAVHAGTWSGPDYRAKAREAL